MTLDSQFFVSDRRTRAEEVLVSESIVNSSDGWPQFGFRFNKGLPDREREGKSKQRGTASAAGKEIRLRGERIQ